MPADCNGHMDEDQKSERSGKSEVRGYLQGVRQGCGSGSVAIWFSVSDSEPLLDLVDPDPTFLKDKMFTF